MRKTAWILLLLFVFSVPWEYSLDLGEPYGNIARILGLVLLLVAIPASMQAGRLRKPGALQWFTLALFLWFCCTSFWTIDLADTFQKLRAYVQEMMIVWFAWEFVESPRDLHSVFRAWLAGSWILAALTIASLLSPDAIAEGQIRFAAIGQDPNDVARFLDLGFPIAALLLDKEVRWPGRLLAFGYFPLGIAAVLLTASRGGAAAAIVAILGSGIVLLRHHTPTVLAGAFAVPLIAATLWLVIPHETLARLATLGDPLQSGDFNQRLNIWEAGWRAFREAPMLGHGVGSFVSAAGLASIDTAHNTAISIFVEGGICAFALASAIVVVAIYAALQTRGPMRNALIALLLTWAVSSFVGTVAESRTTWLLFAVIACAQRLSPASLPGRPLAASLAPAQAG